MTHDHHRSQPYQSAGERPYLTVTEAADYLHVSQRTVGASLQMGRCR